MADRSLPQNLTSIEAWRGAGRRKRELGLVKALEVAGLEPYAFRVAHYVRARAQRNGVCTASLASMVRGCRMSRRRVYGALRHLEARAILIRERNLGSTDRYLFNLQTLWLKAPGLP